ncbi:DUF1656 domain-containing protein [Bradyrhizobium viridifuturi]|uniref:DUF1656 domain-containing protein n=1 Tax=uncultured Bradyrhizobium sp. TaxID=199684 RepID=UPI001BAB6D76|nr:DUF1656 domain-containing protein [Bradyrhizobium viridifuturi]MBR1074895.1 DUF1656 domain-containing protein [Bradyrhizobium viridifuturi]
MPLDLDVYGIYLPSFFGLMLAAYIATLGIRYVASRMELYTLIWHRALFDLSLYVLILGALFALASRLVGQ